MPPPKVAAGKNEPAPPPKGGVRLFLIHGSDDLSATRQADHIVERLCPPAEQAFGLETLSPEGGEKTADAVCAILRNTIEALLTLPFLGGSKTVYLRGAPFFNPLTEPGKFADVKAETERLVEILKQGLPEGVSFILLTSSVNKSTTFYKTFKSLGEVHAFDEPDKPKEAEVDFIPRVEAMLGNAGFSLAPPGLQRPPRPHRLQPPAGGKRNRKALALPGRPQNRHDRGHPIDGRDRPGKQVL